MLRNIDRTFGVAGIEDTVKEFDLVFGFELDGANAEPRQPLLDERHALRPSSDDLEALANAVREAARPRYEPGAPLPTEVPSGSIEVARKGHLRMLTSVDEIAPDLFSGFDE